VAIDYERRFGGIRRLYGEEGAGKIRNAHVCVVGVGGVGSWVVEALARSGVGQITAVDLDMVAESNMNRQIQAMENTIGQAKVDAIAERVRGINPECRFTSIEDFVTPENVGTILDRSYSVVVDAIDQVRTKAAMISFCKSRNIPIVVAGAAGGQIDPTKILISDLSATTQDPLLAKVRSILRREYGFPRGLKKRFGIPAVFSTEPLRYPDNTGECATDRGPMGLACAGFGSSICVTACFGMVAAGHAANLIVGKE